MKKKNNLAIIIIVIAIAVIVVCLGCFIVSKSSNKTTTSNTTINDVNNNDTSSGDKLDVNSSFVKQLYNKVTMEGDSYYKYWFFGNDDNYLASSAPEVSKMALVYHNLTDSDFTAIPNVSALPQTIDLNGSQYTLNASNTKGFVSYDTVVKTYQSLFGTTASLNKETPLQVFAYQIDYYVYNKDLNGYVNYVMESGGTAASFYHGEITNAIRKDGNVIITEKVEYSENKDGKKKVDLTTYYDYTFKEESDGTYSFVSRIKK